MRLLHVKTLKLEYFQDVDVAPNYAILSHRWEDEEVLFEDVQEKPGARELAKLQRKLENTEQRLDTLYRMITEEKHANQRSETVSEPPSLANSEDQVQQTSGQVHDSPAIKKKGWAKVLGCCKIAEEFGMSYVWIDTCCIEKSSSTELSESLNSMFTWYGRATMCIAYLFDVDETWDENHPGLLNPKISTWFSRGWTLQELLAPKEIWFYRGDWKFIGIRSELADAIQKITGIEKAILQRGGLQRLHSVSIAARMAWAARRVTTRPEDRAYSLLGIFGVNMPILYGEGEQSAFFRLQVMIFQMFPDHSIFVWQTSAIDANPFKRGNRDFNLFAPSPTCFSKLEFMEPIIYEEDLTFTRKFQDSAWAFKPMSPQSMCVQLWMRPLNQKDPQFRENERRFETYLGCKNEKEMKLAFTIILVRTGFSQYKRLVNEVCDLQINNYFDKRFSAFIDWTLTDVFISNPRPNISDRKYIKRDYIPITINCATALKSGVEMGDFWAIDAQIEEVSGEEIYGGSLSFSDEWSVAFTAQSVKSGKMCGFVLYMKTPQSFDVYIVYGLNEVELKEHFSSFPLLEKPRFEESQNLIGDMFCYKLTDEEYIYLSCENQEFFDSARSGSSAQLKVGIIYSAAPIPWDRGLGPPTRINVGTAAKRGD